MTPEGKAQILTSVMAAVIAGTVGTVVGYSNRPSPVVEKAESPKHLSVDGIPVPDGMEAVLPNGLTISRGEGFGSGVVGQGAVSVQSNYTVEDIITALVCVYPNPCFPDQLLRDLFAGMALSGFMVYERNGSPVGLAERAYNFADAMMAERNERMKKR